MEYSSEEVKKRIDQNYACIKEAEKMIPLQNNNEKKLLLISLVGKMYSEYITGVYASRILEDQIIAIGRELVFKPDSMPDKNRILIVMSEAAMTGGHTVLVNNWVRWDDMNQYSLVFTNMYEPAIPMFIREAIKNSGGKISCLLGGYEERALKLLEISQHFERVLLFTHMEDVVPVLAYSNKNWKIPVYFYNHADFRFSYGFSVSDIVLNLFEFDVNKTIEYRGVPPMDSILFPFPGQGKLDEIRCQSDKSIIKEKIYEKYGIEEGEKLLVSMGYDFKYENILGYEFDSYVREVLKRSSTKTHFLIIGADKEKEKWINLEKSTQGRGRALGILPRKEAEEIISAADGYIVSFPMLASGRAIAEAAGVPYLCLNIIGRGVRANDVRVANSIMELVEKTLDILNGNHEMYLNVDWEENWSKEKWKRELKDLYSRVNKHKIHAFYPQRKIGKQEYVNCQLMQKQASQEFYTYMSQCALDEKTIKEIYKIDRKYDMGIIYRHIDYLNSELNVNHQYSEKHLQLYLTAINWLHIKQKGKKIDQYLCGKGWHNIAIYGMSYMGKCLAEELLDSSVNLVYGIDKKADRLSSVIPIFPPSYILEKVDLIINTTTIENSVIQKEMIEPCIKMIRLDVLLQELETG